jgi:hypothetical protein
MMPSILDAILVAGCLTAALSYLLLRACLKRAGGSCCEDGKRQNPNRIQIQLPKN